MIFKETKVQNELLIINEKEFRKEAFCDYN